MTLVQYSLSYTTVRGKEYMPLKTHKNQGKNIKGPEAIPVSILEAQSLGKIEKILNKIKDEKIKPR